jgi:tRNA nucleotidyltransferase/poly(A) polymerase
MFKKIPAEILEIIETISKNSFQIYLVGGCVRNLLINKKVIDWDMTTNATPDQIQKLFPDAFYDNDYGTVGIPTKTIEAEHKGVVEITTFRTEQGYSDKRRPDQIKWGKTIEEDLKRRDFTINALALQITTNDQRPTTNIIDPFSGQVDLKKSLIRAVGDPKQRFSEDALRLMRAIRFASQLGFTVEDNTLEAISNNAQLLSHIASERIKDELLKI